MKFKNVFFLLLLVPLSIIGCSNSDSANGSNDGKEQITMWGYSDYDYLLGDLEEEFPDVDFEYNKLPSGDEYKTKLQTTFVGGGEGTDIVQMDDWIPEFYEYKDYFANLYDLGAKDIENDYLDWKWETGVVPGEDYMIGFPVDVAPIAMYYREDLFEEAGLPTDPDEVAEEIETHEDLIKAAKKLEEETNAKMDTASENFEKFIAQSDKKYFDEDENFIGDQDHIKEAWDLAVETIDSNLAFDDTSSTARNVGFDNGDIGLLLHASWFKGDLIDDLNEAVGKWRVAYPAGGGGNRGGSFLGVLETSENKETAYEIVEWMMNEENQIKEFEKTGHIPSTPNAYDDERLHEEEEVFGGQDVGDIYLNSAEDTEHTIEMAEDSQVSDIFKEELEMIQTRGKDEDEAWNEAINKIKEELER